MKLAFFIALFTFGAASCPAQYDSTHVGHTSSKKFYRMSGQRFAQEERSIGLVPEVNFFKNPTLGLSLSRGNFSCGEGCIFGKGMNAGYGYSPFDHSSYAFARAWFSGNIFVIFGFYGGLKAAYRFANNTPGDAVLTPEIGFGLGKLNFFYGRNFFVSSRAPAVGKNSLSVSCYFTIYPGEKKQQ